MDMDNDAVQQKINELEAVSNKQTEQIDELKKLIEKCISRIDHLESSGSSRTAKTPNALNLDLLRKERPKTTLESPRRPVRTLKSHRASTGHSTPDLTNHKELTFNKGEGNIRIYLKGRPVNLAVPSKMAESLDVKNSLPLPDENIKIDWVYGYRGRDCRKNVYYQSSSSDLVYFVAGVVVLHNLNSGEQRHYVEHNDDVKCLAMHPDKVTFASGQVASHSKIEGKPHVRVWSSITLQTLQIVGLGHFDRAVSVVTFSKLNNGTHLCTVDEANDHNITLWDWSKKKMLATSKSSTEAVIDAEYDPKDNDLVVTAGKNHLVFWSLKNGSLTKKTAIYEKYEKPKIVTCINFTQSGELLTGDSSGNIFIWNKEKRVVKKAFDKAHEGPIFSISLLSDDEVLLSGGGKDRLLKRWNLSSRELVKSTELGSEMGCCRCAWPINDNELVIGTTNNYLLQVNNEDNIKPLLSGHHDEIWALSSHPTASSFVSGAFDSRLILWDADSHSMKSMKELEWKIQSVSLNPTNPNQCLVGGLEGQWSLVDISKDGEILCSGKDGVEPIQCCEFSPDGSQAALGSRDNAIYVYKFQDNSTELAKVGKCSGHSSFVTHLDWSVDGQNLRSNSGDYELLFWSVAECKQSKSSNVMADVEWASCNCTLAFETAGIWPEGSDGTDINAVTKAHNKSLLATADDFGKVNLYRYPACTAKSNHKSKPGHSSHVTNVKFLNNDQYLLSCGGQDTAVIQWIIS